MKKLRVSNLGQIREANISFTDLTLFVGPQATGKSIILQLVKLLLDSVDIMNTIKNNGYDWEKDMDNFLELYFGEGMSHLLNMDTQIYLDKRHIDLEDLLSYQFDKFSSSEELSRKSLFREHLFFVPAQRIITLENGWPRSFSSFDIGDPYVVRNFSEDLRLSMQTTFFRTNDDIFPNPNLITQELYNEIDKSIFHGASVELKVTGMRKRIHINIDGISLPFMAWSAGQREFMPLLLSFYWLISTKNKTDIEWVVIEEPEMGLHPQAILSVILICLELLSQGYKLIISTHSPVLLEAVWVIRFLQTENSDIKYLYQLFNVELSPSMTTLFENILKNKTFSTYYFDYFVQQKYGVYVKNISSLDPGDLDSAIADWGGLTSFSSRASEVVSQAVQEKA